MLAPNPPCDFIEHILADDSPFLSGRLPPDLIWNDRSFEEAWDHLCPRERDWVKMWGKRIQVPRFQQAFGADYEHTGSVNNARPIPKILLPTLTWSKDAIDGRLNGLLLNFYEGPAAYIGPHKDSVKGLVTGAPIVTISFGEERVFRLERTVGHQKTVVDFPAPNGTVFLTPYETNLAWKHSVPKRSAYSGRRISVTVRAFSRGLLPPDQYVEPEIESDTVC